MAPFAGHPHHAEQHDEQPGEVGREEVARVVGLDVLGQQRGEHDDEQRQRERRADEREERPRRAQLQQLGAQQGAHVGRPVAGQREEGLLERAHLRREPDEVDARVAGHDADLLGRDAGHEQPVAVALDGMAGGRERARETVVVLRAHDGDEALVAAEHGFQRALAAQLAVRDDDDVVDGLGDLGEQMA